jgi:hypothetical protein
MAKTETEVSDLGYKKVDGRTRATSPLGQVARSHKMTNDQAPMTNIDRRASLVIGIWALAIS